EVCKANSYWIYLDEADEVKSQLGIEMPKSGKNHEESTETDLQAMTQELHLPVTKKDSSSSQDDEFEAFDALEEDGQEDGTKVFSTRSAQRSEGKASRFDRRAYGEQMGQSRPLVLGRVEGPSIWRFVVVGLIILTGIMVAVVIRYLQALP
ncbi:MAG: hypothetical protein ACJ763_14020, partial [Bdellovibrionia bacterium]